MAHLNYRIDQAVHQLRRYGGEPMEVAVELLELIAELNDDMQHLRELESTKRRIVEKTGLVWQPMTSAPRDGRWVCLKPVLHGFWYMCPSVLRWERQDEQEGWYVEEGGLFPDASFSGWSPVPDDGDRP